MLAALMGVFAVIAPQTAYATSSADHGGTGGIIDFGVKVHGKLTKRPYRGGRLR